MTDEELRAAVAAFDRDLFVGTINPEWQTVTIARCYPETIYWAKENCSGEYVHAGRNWAFESEVDATMFLLRWS